METVNLPSVGGLGLKPPSALETRKTYGSTSYTVGVGQGLFHKVKKEEDLHQFSGFDSDLGQNFSTLNVELTADHVPLGEILERLQSDENSGDRNNFIRLHAVTDNSSSPTISATLNVATLDLSSNSSFQSHMSEFHDVLFNMKSDPSHSPTSTCSSSLLSSPSFSPSVVPEVTTFLNNNSLLSCDMSQSKTTSNNPSLSPHGFEMNKTSPQECSLCNKMFGNASALAKHRLTHSDERKYLCTVCHKAFKRQDHLNGHLLTHRNKKPFECTAEGCNKSYCDARSLRRHRENHHSNKDDKMVSPASSVSSSFDNDDKSTGSDTFDNLRNSKSTKLGIDKDKSPIKVETQSFTILEKYIRNEKHDNVYSNGRLKPVGGGGGGVPSRDQDQNPNMVECTICSRRFKNIPALNGHMRLHGGYYRKDNDKKQEMRNLHAEPMSNHTVSNNVKNLIEEKIIQKRKLEPVQMRQLYSPGCSDIRYSLTPSSCSTQTLCSTTNPGDQEPPSKRIHKSISSLDNLVFPVLPQPDTSKLLANLQSKQAQIAGFLPAQPLPNVPLPSSKCFSPVKPTETHVKSAHIHNLLKVDKQHKYKEPRLGSEYQAEMPNLETRRSEDKYGILSRETLMWSSSTAANLPSPQVDTFLRFCSSAAVSAVLTAEDAMQVLNRHQGDAWRASQEVMAYPWTKTDSAPASWSPDQVDMFYEALCKHKKNFVRISGDIPGKTVKDCVEFYYSWKNLCREESQSFKPIINSSEDLSAGLPPL